MEKGIFTIVVIAMIGIAIFHITHKSIVVCGQYKNGNMEVTARYENCSIDSTGAIDCWGRMGKILPNRAETCMETYEARK